MLYLKSSQARRGGRPAIFIANTLGLMLMTSIFLGGCRVSEDEIHGWARRTMGPIKLEAVITHDKYEKKLKVEAALTLVSMAPRNGRLVGLLGNDDFQGLLSTLAELPTESRSALTAALVEPLAKGANQEADEEGKRTALNYQFKDAIFGLLNQEGLVTAPAQREGLKDALIQFLGKDIQGQLDNTSQVYPLEQLVRFLRPEGARPLLQAIEGDSSKLNELCGLIKNYGDEALKEEAGARLVAIAEEIDSDDFRKRKTPAVEESNKKNGVNVTPEQFQEQLAKYQSEELLRIVTAMKSIGHRAVVKYLLQLAGDEEREALLRGRALEALEDNLDAKDHQQAEILLKIFRTSSTPDDVRALSLSRLAEFERKLIAADLYELFKDERWQVRASAAALILQLSDISQLEEFMKHVGEQPYMSINESFSYGNMIADLKGGDAAAQLRKWSAPSQPTPARLAALGYYFQNGESSDLPFLKTMAEDRGRIPPCADSDTSCSFACQVEVAGKVESQEMQTLGDYISKCILPQIEARAEKPATSSE